MDYIPNTKVGDIYNYSYAAIYVDSNTVTGEYETDTIGKYQESDTYIEIESTETTAYYKYSTNEGEVHYFNYYKEIGILTFSYHDGLYHSDEDYVMLKTPIEVGNEWFLFDVEEYRMEIKSMNETYENGEILVKDVILTEMIVEDDYSTIIQKFYYSPSIGLVKREMIFLRDNSTHTYRTELTSIVSE